MELEQLFNFVSIIVFVGVLLGVGILVMDKYGVAVKDSTNVVNETVAISSSAGSTTYDDVTAMTYFGNATVDHTTYIAGDGINYTTAGAITVNSSVVDGNYDVSYTYDADSTSTTVSSNVVTAMSPIATTWMPLIVTIMVLSIILTLVIRSFAKIR